MDAIERQRRFYAELIVRSAGSTDDRLISAFASVPREDFVGPGPWQVFVGSGYIPTVSDDPRYLYQDILIGLAPERKINNGQPSLHAQCLAAAKPAAGDTAVHVGAGTGYYTAVLARLVQRVIAFEMEADLSARARENLTNYRNVTVRNESATDAVIPAADLIYVSAGATHPHSTWLDALNIGGRLAFPLTPNEGFGIMLLVTRKGPDCYSAEAISRASFIPCIGARDDATSASIVSALERQTMHHIRSLRRNGSPDQSAWCVGHGWWLSSESSG